MSGLNVLVFLGSTREGRMGERVSKFVVNSLKSQGHTVDLVDPLTQGDGHVHQPLHFRKDKTSAPQWMLDTHDLILKSDAIMIVTPEYNCGLPPALVGTMDQYPPASYRHKPASIVTYSMGSFGGIRAAAFARPFLSELGMVSLPATVTIPQVQEKFSAEGACSCDRIKASLTKAISELTWYGSMIKAKMQLDGSPSKSEY